VLTRVKFPAFLIPILSYPTRKCSGCFQCTPTSPRQHPHSAAGASVLEFAVLVFQEILSFPVSIISHLFLQELETPLHTCAHTSSHTCTSVASCLRILQRFPVSFEKMSSVLTITWKVPHILWCKPWPLSAPSFSGLALLISQAPLPAPYTEPLYFCSLRRDPLSLGSPWLSSSVRVDPLWDAIWLHSPFLTTHVTSTPLHSHVSAWHCLHCFIVFILGFSVFEQSLSCVPALQGLSGS
jgi:hypothetical protein